MQFNLNGKSALVTGSSRGIGLAIANALHVHGCKVALNSRNAKDLAINVSKLPGAIGVVGDVTSATDANNIVTKVIQSFGKLDILVCNVGCGRSALPGQESGEDWLRMFDLNLWGAINTISAAHKTLAESRGAIVCISSICGIAVIPDAPIPYSVAKAALNAYVRGIARPFGKEGIRINAIAPGNILCDNSVWSRKLEADPVATASMLERDVALNKFGTPEDIANLAVYLASDCAAFATGEIWKIDGGHVR